MIPKIIHYCWFGGKKKTAKIEEYISSWKKFCPDYNIREWNESNFDIKSNQYVYEAYQAKKWAFVSDYVRLKVLYDYGGFYMDTDVELVKSLDSLRIYDAVSGYESTTAIPTGTIGSIAKNEWIGMLLQDYDNRHFLLSGGRLDLTTNVETISKLTVQKYKIVLNGKKILFGSNIVILPFEYLCAKDFETGIIHQTDKTITIHHFNGSWLSEYDKYNDNMRRKLRKIFPYYMSKKIATYFATIKYKGLIQANKRFLNWMLRRF
mgnify:CR=1 FL=1